MSEAEQTTSNVMVLVYHHKNEMKKEIEREFIEVLKNNVINPYSENVVLMGETFVFKYIGTKRFKHVVHLKFNVYRRYEFERMHESLCHLIGRVIVTVRVR